jgi:hypothetical protein
VPTTSFPNSTQPDLERQKFVPTQGVGEVAVRVANADGSTIGGGAGGGGTSMVDESNYTLGSSSENPVGLAIKADPPDQVALGVAPADVKTAGWAGTVYRAGHVNLRDASGNEVASATADVAGGVQRGLVVRVASMPAGGGGGGGTQYTEDAASAGGESLTLAGAVRQDAPSATTSADGDYTNLKTDNLGRLWTNPSGVTQPVSGTITANVGTTGGLALDATVSGVAKDGTPITGQTLETGGASVLGWLSSLRKAITDRLPAALVGGRLDVNLGATSVTQPVSGTFWQATQPVSGTVTANVGTTNGLALDATLTGGTAKTIVRGGQKGATAANADVTHTAEGADHEALDVQLYHGGVAKDPTAVRALTSADVVTQVPTRGTLTNRSGSITTGGTSQQLAASNAARLYLFVQNIAGENLWINFGTAAVQDQPSVRLQPGDSFVMEAAFIDNEAVNIIGATTGSKFVAKEG